MRKNITRGSAVVSPAQCMRFAALCVDLAQADSARRSACLEMASAWLNLASDSLGLMAHGDPDLFITSYVEQEINRH
jgi:hypothetical protein